MNPSLEHAYVGLGPMPLEKEYMVANQESVVNDVVEQIGLTCEALASRKNLPEDNQNFAPHHVVSIIGDRGTGKTSVVTTIAKQVKKQVKNAFVIDLISPDQLSKKFPVSAIIVYAIERALENQKEELKEKHQLEKIQEIEKFRPVSWAVEIPETFEVLSRDTINTKEWHDKLFTLMVSPVKFVPDFHEWLGKILKAIGYEVCVISIDDADISVEKAEEIIETIRIYLASPRIVTLLAVDLPSLERKLRNARLAKLPPVPEYKEKEDKGGFFLFGLSRGEHQSAEAQAEQEYVENLLVKVLPPATRYYLTGLSETDKLNKPFQIPGRVGSRCLFDIIQEADEKSPEKSGVDLARLFKKYPDILTNNVRRYSNQFVLISNFCQQYITEISKPKPEKAGVMAKNRSSISQTVGNNSKVVENELSQESFLKPIETHNQFIRSKFQMQIMRSFLSEGEFASLQSYIIQNLNIDIQQFQTIHELANFILDRGEVTGSYNFRLRYEIVGKPVKNRMSTALIDLLGDWMLESGGKMQDIIDRLRVPIRVAAFPDIQIPKPLSKYFSKLSIEPNIAITSTAFDKYIGENVVVPVDKERLMPGYIKDFRGLGRYTHLVLSYERIGENISSAKKYVTVLDELKKDELQKTDLQSAVYRIFGLLAKQTFYHLFHLIVELRFDGDIEKLFTSPQSRNRLNSSTDSTLSWLIVDVPDTLGSLHEIMERDEKELSYSQKLLALSYIADLPMTILLGCVAGKDAEQKRNNLLTSIRNLFKELTNIGLITNPSQARPIGKLNPNPSGKAAEILKEMKKHYPSFKWERRWQAMDVLINKTLKNATFEKSWKSAEQPPKLWVKWADDILVDFSPEDLKETDADKDKSDSKVK
ncbi:hypothetical protein NIES4074_35310 [Cylindrospermum sp. NIES-4074]|nr:hypothetical protein NIES4074_35310 [Cylindrospermum sp. NIES-4074]